MVFYSIMIDPGGGTFCEIEGNLASKGSTINTQQLLRIFARIDIQQSGRKCLARL